MTGEEVTAVIVVDRLGRNGKCSNCNKAIEITTETHACGARVTGIAIEHRRNVTFTDATLVAAMRSNVEFMGTGRIVKAPSGRLWFQRLKYPGDLR
jgi:hypothetical protein